MLPHLLAPLLLTLSLKEGKTGNITYILQTEELRQAATFSGPLDYPAASLEGTESLAQGSAYQAGVENMAAVCP